MPVLGRNAFVGFAAEATWGTAEATLTHYFRVMSGLNFSSIDRKDIIPTLRQASGSFHHRHHFEALNETGGTFRTPLMYEGCGVLLTQIMGASPATGAPSGGIYPHTWALGTSHASATLHVARGLGVGGSTAKAEIVEGASFNRVTIGIEQGGYLYYEAEVIAETSTQDQTLAGSPVFPSDLPILHHQGGSVVFNSVTYKARGWRLVIDRKLVRDYTLGSQYTGQPFASADTEIYLEADLQVSAETAAIAQRADTQGDAVISFTGTGSRTAAFTVQNAYIETVDNPVANQGIRYQTVRFRAEDDGTDKGLGIAIGNTQTTAEAA